MIGNAALVATVALLVIVGWLASALDVLVPYKATLFAEHGVTLAVAALVLFGHLCAGVYALSRRVFLRDTGSKLAHLDSQIGTPDGVHDDLFEHVRGPRR